MTGESVGTAVDEVLLVSGVSKSFGGLQALKDVSFRIERGEIVALIGPNGSGKSTLFNCVLGDERADSGHIRVLGREVLGLSSHRIARNGIMRTYQATEVFSALTVRENLLLAGHVPSGVEWTSQASFAELAELSLQDRVDWVLGTTALAPVESLRAGNLSYGQRKIVALAMAFVRLPSILLLDEPMAGLNPTLIRHMIGLIREINRHGVSVGLVEHNLTVVMKLAHRVSVLNAGRNLIDGEPSVIRQDERVVEAYFGS